MTGPAPDIETALSGDGPIPSEQVLSWIDAASDSDLPTLSKLYRLTGEGYYRIQPELGRGPTCALIQRYLLGCIRDGVNDNDEIQERYEAAETLHDWFRQLVGMDGTTEVHEVEWLTGNPAAKYLNPGKKSTRQDNRDVVVLRRVVGKHECYEAMISQELADYLRGLPTQTVQVQYTVTYDFFQFRTYSIWRIGDLGYHPNGSSWIPGGDNIGGDCF